MQPLLFFSRVTFICNICFVVAVLLYFIPVNFTDGNVFDTLVSTVVILGMLVSIVLNAMLNCIIITLLLMRKPLWPVIPKWLIIFNLFCLIPQIIFSIP